MALKDDMAADNAVFVNSSDFGYSAKYTSIDSGVVECNVLIDFDSDLRPDNIDIGLIEVGITIEALVSDVGIPKQGDTFEIDGTTYRVARVDSNDHVFVKVVVTEVIS